MVTPERHDVDDSRRGLWPPPLPREHGAWMMLVVPLIVGALAGGSLDWPVILTFIAAFFAYLARHPLVLIARARGDPLRLPRGVLFWLAVYSAVAGLSGLAVIAFGSYWLLIPIAALAGLPLGVNLYLAARHAEMSIVGEMLGIAGLALGAPATYYVAFGAPGLQMVGLWLLTFFYFGGTVFYVKLKVRVHSRQDPPHSTLQRLLIGRVTLFYHAAVIGFAALLVATGLAPLLAPLAYVPVTCRAIQGVFDWRRAVNIKRLGVIEIAHSLIFATLLIIAYR